MSVCVPKARSLDPRIGESRNARRLVSGNEVTVYSTFQAGQIRINYLRDENTGTIGLLLLPEQMADQTVEHRSRFGNTRAWTVDGLVQIKCVGDSYPGFFCQGKTMHNSSSTGGLKFVEQKVEETAELLSIGTFFSHELGYACEHRLSWRRGESFLESTTTFTNLSDRPICLEALSSFSLGGVTPYAADDATGRLMLHRLRSSWCAEGRLESTPIEELQLEGFHYAHVPVAERFGQIGSMPVRGWFPFVAIEDTEAGVLWGAQLACPGSWQMELYRCDDMVNLSGGLADREFGHWMKSVAPGQSFASPSAILTTVAGDIDALCTQLVEWQERAPTLDVEADLPIVFNDWCTHWGKPDHHKTLEIAKVLEGRGVGYLVIDAGWYDDHGGWRVNEEIFPSGLEQTAREIRKRGLIPGLWFEIETCDPISRELPEREADLLRRDGVSIATRTRHFWDFRNAALFERLFESMTKTLERCDFGYVKIDYNDTVGIGCDGAESLGEGLRQHLEAVQDFWRKTKRRLPGLVIENCSSGGHRLEPSMMALADQNSFSDAHELVSIPIVAANLHRAVLPRKLQVWAVLREKDDQRRLVYSLAAAMLGRMGLSGDITKLSVAQSATLDRAIGFYCQARAVIRKGLSYRAGPEVLSYRNPTQWQVMVRHNESIALVVCHGFAKPIPELIEVELPSGTSWKILEVFQSSTFAPEICAGRLLIALEGEWSACAVLLVSRHN